MANFIGFGQFQVVLSVSSDGLDKDQILPKGIQKFPDPLGGLWQAAMATSGSHTTDKHSGIEVMLLHADPIAEDGATRKRAGGIDRNNTNGFALLAGVGGEFVGNGAFADAGRPRNAHTVSPAQGRGKTSHDLWHFGAVPFDVGHQLRQRPLVASEHPLD